MLSVKKKIIATISLITVVAIVITSVILFGDKKSGNKKLPNLESIVIESSSNTFSKDYDTYLSLNSNLGKLKEDITIEVNSKIEEGREFSFEVNTQNCLASIELRYRINSNGDGDGACTLKMNGEVPFREANNMVLKRHWLSQESQKDVRGNEYSVALSESNDDIYTSLSDASGFHTEPFEFAFGEGKNIISITAEKGNIELISVRLFDYTGVPSYSVVSKSYPKSTENSKKITVQGELPYLRTNTSILEICDRTSSVTVPKFNGLQVWNSIGGTGWNTSGQSITWKINVENTGLYSMALRFKNNYKSGVSCYRKLYIDDKIPFDEMNSVQFPYATGWQVTELSDSENQPYLFYLEEGEHTLTLEVTLGEQANVLNVAQKSLARLNEAYRKIVMVTGANPDKYRDYQVAKKLPEVIEILEEQLNVLNQIADWLNIKNNGKGEGTATVDKLIWQIKEYIEYPENIPQTLSTYSSNIMGFSDWIQSSTAQPLTIDCIELLAPNNEPMKSEAGFFKQLKFNTSLFIKSFAEDYGVIGNVYNENKAIEVWLTLGRDQYQIIKEQVDNYFIAENEIGVNLKLVAGGILEATVAGIEPDVYLFADQGMPVNFAARGALADLTQFKDFNDVTKRFAKESMVPFEYDGGVYAIPISQSFLVMFTRDDILKEIGLEVPKTWNDVYNCLTILQQNNMEFAFPEPSSGYELFLFQKQEDVYKNNGKAVAIDSEAGIWAFEQWTKLYTDYSALMSYSFTNRFRTGDMPIGIVDFGTFNTLEVSAPEISGLWSMHPVPGTMQEDGSIKHISSTSTSAAVMLNTTKHPNESWEFIKWFTSEEEQYRYATAIENRQGISGRFSTANISAFNRLGWSASTLETINFQRETALAIEQVPGGYFLSRHINNIFRKVVNQDANVRETVMEYTDIINKEITKKRKEFGLEVDG